MKIGKNPYSTGGYLFSSRQSGTDNFGININTSMQLVVDGAIGGTAINLITTPVYRDSSAWYHILLAVDTTQATSTNRVKLYVNGTQVTAFGTATYPTQSNTSVNLNTAIHNVSGYNNSSNYFDGYMADVNFVDGQALTPSSFGANDPNTGVWSPVPYSGTYGTNGFRLSFQDNTGTTATTLGKDWSGQGNNWTPNNFSVAAGSGNDSLTDGPTNWGIDYGNGGEVRGNYCTVNPLSLVPNAAGYNNITNGNLDTIAPTGDTAGVSNIGTFAVSTGKWYWEATYYQNTATGYNPAIGISVLNSSTGMLVYQIDGNKNNSGSTSAYGATFTTNDVIGVALNMDAGTLTFYKNGVSQGTAFTGITGQYFPFFLMNRTGTASSGWYTNFGQRPFAYTAPSGFKALNTQNLPTPAVGATSTTLADDYFNIALYTGNGTAIGSGGKAVTGIGFQPDFVWIKGRSGATDHGLYDAVRGTTKQLESNTTDAETTQSEGLTTFGSDGFTVGSLAQLNTNAATYVGWAWKANGAGVSNTSGSISSTVSANQTAGIAVVTWTNPASGSWTVGHGLGVAPKMIITKGRSGTNGWVTYHESLGNTKAVVLSSTAAADTNSAYWNNTSPTSSVFSMGSASVIGASYTMVAYCFAEIAGFSKFGSYTGNGSTDGPFVYCGFRPRFVMIKNASNVANWTIVDTSRNTYNVANARLFPSNSDAESTAANNCDILSNGFKVRNGTDTGVNTNNETYIFAVFAESPFNYSRAR